MRIKDPVLVRFGNRVREERLKRSLSQEKLAEITGLHRTYIGMIERAEKNITLLNIVKIAKGLNLNIKTLFEHFESDDHK
jgi:transcriptional regulator with XRE-family HTH domain